MYRILSNVLGFALVAMSLPAAAQEVPALPLDRSDHRFEHHLDHPVGHDIGHDYWHHETHVPDVVQLDAQADRLAKVVRHLHEDAHKLNQDYHHSDAIELYVDRVDRLQQHVHEVLHESMESGTQSTSLSVHIKSDVRQVKSYLTRLYSELNHQGYDGARTEDFHAMAHMRQIIRVEAFPLIREMEVGLYGYQPYDHLWSFHNRRPSAPPVIQRRVRNPPLTEFLP